MFYIGHTNLHSSPAESDAISKYLVTVQYVPPPPVKNTVSTRVTGSRVLTSAEGYAMLHEKEEKKKTEEEKDRRKQEREQKREKKCLRKQLEKGLKKCRKEQSARVRGRPLMIQQIQYQHDS